MRLEIILKIIQKFIEQKQISKIQVIESTISLQDPLQYLFYLAGAILFLIKLKPWDRYPHPHSYIMEKVIKYKTAVLLTVLIYNNIDEGTSWNYLDPSKNLFFNLQLPN